MNEQSDICCFQSGASAYQDTHLPISVLGRALRVYYKRLAERNSGLHFESFV